ncbi:DUF2591 family protein [Candidatus Pacearchaeota archaeon]|nr:DUF2591 family protein [Candidatus Pacearchaeota archaeon]
MNFEEMSDIEINQAVVVALNPQYKVKFFYHDSEEIPYCWAFINRRGGYSSAVPMPDYCNDWSNAGPLMTDNYMILMPAYISLNEDSLWHAVDCFENYGSGRLINPLRAIAICYLKMKAAENGSV